MIYIEISRSYRFKTIVSIQRLLLRQFMTNIRMSMILSEERERIQWKLAERPNNSFYYFVKDDEEVCGFIRIQTKR